MLSACTTASTNVAVELEPVSISTAFLAAGCARVLGTLWSVNDLATCLLMERLYSLLLSAQRPRWSDALRQAQLDLLRGTLQPNQRQLSAAFRARPVGRLQPATQVSLSSPFYWAGFVCMGAP